MDGLMTKGYRIQEHRIDDWLDIKRWQYDELVLGWMIGWMDGRTDRWMDGWMIISITPVHMHASLYT